MFLTSGIRVSFCIKDLSCNVNPREKLLLDA